MSQKNMSRRAFGTGATATIAGMASVKSTLAAAIRSPADTPTSTVVTGDVGYPFDVTRFWTGSHSHYLQPWRPLITTRSLTSIVNGLGIQNQNSLNPETLPLYAAAGFTQIRTGFNWGQASASDSSTIPLAANQLEVTYLQAIKAAGLRPLVLVQAFDQLPCPFVTAEVAISQAVTASEVVLTLANTSGLVPHFSGPTRWSTDTSPSVTANYISPNNVRCPAFFTSFDGDRATLSKPLGIDIPAGAILEIDTLSYKPFSNPGSADYQATMNGWLAFLGAVSRFVSSVLGTEGTSDLGFDLEIWNEVSFGGNFLDINNYYTPAIVPESYSDYGYVQTVTVDLINQSSAYIEANPALFAGVRVANGFASELPWPASADQPPAISAFTKHPYPSPVTYPAADSGYCALDITGNVTAFVPSYELFLHEFAEMASFPYTMSRDISPETSSFNGSAHGVDARTINGAMAPVTVWITETGTSAREHGVTGAAVAPFVAKGTLRALFFHLGAGVERVYLFQGVGDPGAFALLDQNAPTTPTVPLNAVRNAMSIIHGGISPGQEGNLYSLTYQMWIVYGSGAALFRGNGSNNTPDFVQPNDFVLIPIQVTPKRIAFVFYFIALDMRDSMNLLGCKIAISGLPPGNPTVNGYDPVTDDGINHAFYGQTGDTATVVAFGNDSPRILTFEY